MPDCMLATDSRSRGGETGERGVKEGEREGGGGERRVEQENK